MDENQQNTAWMKGKCFVLTGGFNEEGVDYMTSLIAEAGGYTQRTVTPDVDYVIWNPYFFGETAKLKQAQEFNGQGANIAIYNLDEFVALMNGDSVESEVIQCNYAIDHIAEYLSRSNPEIVEAYLETHGLQVGSNQWILMDLLKSYNRTSILPQQKWCYRIWETEGLIYNLYKMASLYFTRIHDLEKAADLCGRLLGAELAIGQSNASIAEDQAFLLEKIERYRKKPYWPKNARQRVEIVEIYDQNGIPHPMIDAYGNVIAPAPRARKAASETSVEEKPVRMRSAEHRMVPLTDEKLDELRTSMGSIDYTLDDDNKYSAFVDSDAFHIDGIGSKTIGILLDTGLVKSFGDIFRLKNHREELIAGKILPEQIVDRLLNSIERAREISDIRFLTALHIPGLGEDSCRKILKQYAIHDLLKLGEAQEDLYQLTDVPGIGVQISASFFLWFENETNTEMLRDLLQEITIREESKAEIGSRCSGLTFVTTGKVFVFKNRDALKQYVFSQGGEFSETLNKDTSYLINNDLDSPSAKNKKANKLGIPIISEQQFIEMFGDGSL